jgi:hypothetical protein
METKKQYIISETGQFFREDIMRKEILPGDALQKAFSTNIVVTTRGLMELPGHGQVHLIYEQATETWHFSVPMQTINFRTTFKPITTDEGYKDQLYPTFADAGSKEPMMEIEWNKQDACISQSTSMNLVFLVQVKRDNGSYYAADHYFYAFDDKKSAWRLPIANLYNTCQVCMGGYESTSTTAVGAVFNALRQFRSASWNEDLFNHGDSVWKFIRFKALKKGFETQPIIDSWTSHCDKISTPQLKFCLV